MGACGKVHGDLADEAAGGLAGCSLWDVRAATPLPTIPGSISVQNSLTLLRDSRCCRRELSLEQWTGSMLAYLEQLLSLALGTTIAPATSSEVFPRPNFWNQ